MNQSNVTTIEWYTLPKNGNGGAAIVRWRASTSDTYDTFFRDYNGRQYNALSYLLGDKPPRYPLPALTNRDALFDWALRAKTNKQWKQRLILANIIT